MLQGNSTAKSNVIEGPELGTVLDGKYLLIDRLPAMAGRPRYHAQDVLAQQDVELVVLGDRPDGSRYRVRPMRRAAAEMEERAVHSTVVADAQHAPAVHGGSPTCEVETLVEAPAEPFDGPEPQRVDDTVPNGNRTNRRAMEAFEQRIALTGVSVRRGDRLVFHGWDKELQRMVRVIVEPLD